MIPAQSFIPTTPSKREFKIDDNDNYLQTYLRERDLFIMQDPIELIFEEFSSTNVTNPDNQPYQCEQLAYSLKLYNFPQETWETKMQGKKKGEKKLALN